MFKYFKLAIAEPFGHLVIDFQTKNQSKITFFITSSQPAIYCIPGKHANVTSRKKEKETSAYAQAMYKQQNFTTELNTSSSEGDFI